MRLRSAHCGDLCVPSMRTEFGKRSFRVAAPRTWNSLPLHLHSPTISRQQFQSGLKTHLFKHTYTWLLTPRTIEEWTYLLLLTSSFAVLSHLHIPTMQYCKQHENSKPITSAQSHKYLGDLQPLAVGQWWLRSVPLCFSSWPEMWITLKGILHGMFLRQCDSASPTSPLVTCSAVYTNDWMYRPFSQCLKWGGLGGSAPLLPFEPPAIVWTPWLNL